MESEMRIAKLLPGLRHAGGNGGTIIFRIGKNFRGRCGVTERLSAES
jgi:hypothetical protein